MTNGNQFAPIGIFDSGVGGISVLRTIREELPNEALVYFADQAHVPYGERTLEEVRKLAEEITRFLIALDAKLIVVACNTASAAALQYLRAKFPSTPFVGMEPAVKPAAKNTQSGVLGILATPATFQGKLYTSLIERFANSVTVLQDTCPGLVAQIEKGHINSPKTRSILETALVPMLDKGVDTVVLGCTHYPFVIPMIQEIKGPGVTVIDPAPAVARQTVRLLERHNLGRPAIDTVSQEHPSTCCIRLMTSGADEDFAIVVNSLLEERVIVEKAFWRDGSLNLKHPA